MEYVYVYMTMTISCEIFIKGTLEQETIKMLFPTPHTGWVLCLHMAVSFSTFLIHMSICYSVTLGEIVDFSVQEKTRFSMPRHTGERFVLSKELEDANNQSLPGERERETHRQTDTDFWEGTDDLFLHSLP